MSYAVIFTSQRSDQDAEGYAQMAEAMDRLAREQKGFLGVVSARGSDGLGITVSRWATLEDIARWRSHSKHVLAQDYGRQKWYSSFTTLVCRVEREQDWHGLVSDH